MAPRLYRIIEHTADTGFEVRGATKEQVYENAAKAFFDIMWQIKSRRKSKPENIEVSGIDREELLVNFLEEFLYLYDAKRLVCTGIEVDTVTDINVCAQAWLQKFDVDCDRELLSVKAVTYHQLFLGQEKGAWRARIFLDI
jgi:SHS2 domain-containing protein